ncbi:MAG: hypothetical protein M0000_10510 [Actinomycetota bacterium]|nr:hypothetical protein [Actinomycetota bacterium]
MRTETTNAVERLIRLTQGWSPRRVSLAAAVMYLLYLIGRITLAAHGDMGALVVAGSAFVTASQVPVHIPVLAGTGYDGQFYFRIAMAPFDFAPHALGITFDSVFRMQRIVYPLVSWVLSLGSPHLLLYVLPAVNLAALAGLAWVLASFAVASGKHPLFGLLAALYPGYALSLGRDLTEPLAAFTLMLGLYLLERDKYLPAAIVLGVSVLTREAGTLVVMAIGIAWLVGVVRGRSEGSSRGLFLAAAVPTIAFLGWQAVVRSQAGHFVLTGFAESNLGVPFGQLMSGILTRLTSPPNTGNLLWFIQFAGLTIVVVASLVLLRRSTAPRWVKISLVATLILMVSLAGGEWTGDADLRSIDQLWLLSWLVMFKAPRLNLARWSPLVLIWAITAGQLALFI